jgi:protein-S-isoprenylcysteine O-methyltransferase Ste14
MPPIKDRLFVLAQLSLFIIYVLIPPRLPQVPALKIPGYLLLGVGILVVLLSIYELRKHLSPFPTPLKNGSLVTSGIYNYVRHPIYTGIILTLAGHILTSPTLGRILVTGLLAVLFLYKSSYEEKLLLKTYPDYRDYKQRTWRFFPGF